MIYCHLLLSLEYTRVVPSTSVNIISTISHLIVMPRFSFSFISGQHVLCTVQHLSLRFIYLVRVCFLCSRCLSFVLGFQLVFTFIILMTDMFLLFNHMSKSETTWVVCMPKHIFFLRFQRDHESKSKIACLFCWLCHAEIIYTCYQLFMQFFDASS